MGAGPAAGLELAWGRCAAARMPHTSSAGNCRTNGNRRAIEEPLTRESLCWDYTHAKAQSGILLRDKKGISNLWNRRAGEFSRQIAQLFPNNRQTEAPLLCRQLGHCIAKPLRNGNGTCSIVSPLQPSQRLPSTPSRPSLSSVPPGERAEAVRTIVASANGGNWSPAGDSLGLDLMDVFLLGRSRCIHRFHLC